MQNSRNTTTKYLENASYSWTSDSIRLIQTPSAMAKATFFYLSECGYFKTFPPYFTERKNLNSFLIVYTISGSGTLTYGGNTYSVQKGQLFFINCMNHHYYAVNSSDKDSSWEFLWFHFNGSGSLGYYEEFIKNGFSILDVQDEFFFESTIRRMISINQKRLLSYEALTSNLICNILTECLMLSASQNASLILIPKYIRELIKYLDQHFCDELPLDELSSLFSVSKYHMEREFKKYTGTSIREYIIQSRISYAKELLKYSELSIEEIAFSCGMNQVSHFISLFKARESMTPLAFRKEWKIN